MEKSNISVSPIIQKILALRGYDQENLDSFFSWNLNHLPDFSLLLDIKKSALRIKEAIKKNECIGIYGDYDVDGCTSCALLFHFFKLLDIEVKTFQPSRFVEGYGLHPPAIDNAIEENIKLLITVDCGITNHEAAAYAKEKGIDLIITDHHNDVSDIIPDAFSIINPNRRDEPENSIFSPLAGVGVAFALALEIKKLFSQMPSIYSLLQFVAIGTICDMAKLTPVNLKLVRHGLKQLPKTEYPGLKVFLSNEERELKIIPSEKLGFNIGPMINSKGRLEHPAVALELLKTSDTREAEHLHTQLEVSNSERKYIQREVFVEAKKIVESEYSENHLITIVYQPHWHEGVIGIVSSRLVETFMVPAIVFTDTDDENIVKASARSAGDLDLFNCLNQCSDLFDRFGGHKAAAGLSMQRKNLPKFIDRMNKILKEIPVIVRTVGDYYDLEIATQDITPRFLRDLELLEPYGMGNKKPVFKMNEFKINNFKEMGAGKNHIKWSLSPKEERTNLTGISFNYYDKWNTPNPAEICRNQSSGNLEAYFTLGINRFRGNETIQLLISKITY